MTGLSDYVRLLRIHTSAETQGLVLIGYLAAGGSNLGVALFWLVYGVVSHAWGFLQNNLLDFEADRADPEKRHFPLVSGVISYRRALGIDTALLVWQPVLGLFLIGPISWSFSGFLVHPFAWLFMFFSIFFGTAYNYLSKRSLAGPLYISLAYLNLSLVSYFSVADHLTWGMFLIAVYVFFTIWWQISYSGYLKDVGTDRVNLLRKLGMIPIRKNGTEVVGVMSSTASRIYGYLLRLPTMIILPFLIIYYSPFLWVILTTLFLWGLTLTFVEKLVNIRGQWDHHKAVMRMAVVEVLVYYSLVVVLSGSIGLPWTIFLLAYPTAWYAAMNKVAWGTTLTPRV